MQERVLIVAKTRMKTGACVSGLTRISNKNIRLIPTDRKNQSSETEFDVGQVWDIDYQEVVNVDPPHVEDVSVMSQQYVSQISNVREILMQRIQPWRGGLESLYSNTLTIGSRKCYVCRSGPIPAQSTGYWLPNRELLLYQDNNKFFYLVDYTSKVGGILQTREISIPYVGFSSPIECIPLGTLVRVSLARWFSVEGEERCYLQISGWY